MAPVELPGGLTAAYATLRNPERPSLGPVVAEEPRLPRHHPVLGGGVAHPVDLEG